MSQEFSWGKYTGLVVFSVLLGFTHASVAFYLRTNLGIEGDPFPLKTGADGVLGIFSHTEYYREISSLGMTVIASILFANRYFYRILAFILMLGFTDLSYYAFLRGIHGWPDSVFAYDLLLLFPTIWVSPVFAPLLLAVTMSSTTSFLLFYSRNRGLRNPEFLDVLLLTVGFVLLLYAFMSESEYYLGGGMPPRFSWGVYWTGYGLCVAGLLSYFVQVWRFSKMRFI